MEVNPDKFLELLTDNHKIDSENSVTLLGIKVDQLNFEKHVIALCQKAGRQSNTLSRIYKYIEFQEMKCYLTVLYS